ncbi:hypothetical protein QBC37DRAFT_374968 [Rhypophila decipiens]|uniref:Uncharacterized protein n=1 Tax=Rhypophila decipiens TaxID=261697 RepID=A0AAN7B926_9PEZI|nr:hypothetical protein QBC37DRAFT_374968 [Rhypophila decipiens]
MALRLSRVLIISHLPKGINTGILLDALAVGSPFGDKVLSAETGTPCFGGSDHRAAMIEMWTHDSANAIFNFIRGGHLKIDGLVARCDFGHPRENSPNSTLEAFKTKSRVLVIKGDPKKVNHERLKDYIRKDPLRGIWFDDQSMEEFTRGSSQTVVWHLAGVGGALNARKLLDYQVKAGNLQSVGYGADCLAVGTETAFQRNVETEGKEVNAECDPSGSSQAQVASQTDEA